VSLLSAAAVRLENVADVVAHASTRMTHQVYRHQVTPTIGVGRAAMESIVRGSGWGSTRRRGRHGHSSRGPTTCANQRFREWAVRDSNPRPLARHASALPTAPTARGTEH
jgi:hypothetical protein